MADVLLTSTEEVIQLTSVSGASTADITSAVNAHSALATGVHGVGASTVASAVSVAAAVTAHNASATAHGQTAGAWAGLAAASSPGAGNAIATLNDLGSQLSDRIMALTPLAYLKLSEPVGTSGANSVIDASGNVHHGTPTAVTFGATGIGDGLTAASFDGATSVIDWYSAGLAAAFLGSEVTLEVWCKVNAAADWTDGADHEIVNLSSNTTPANYLRIGKTTTNNQLLLMYAAGGVARNVTTTCSETGWIHLAIVASLTGNYCRFYLNGSQIGADQTVGTWGAPLSAVTTCIGSYIGAGSYIWHGTIAHVAVYNVALNPARIAMLYQFGVFF